MADEMFSLDPLRNQVIHQIANRMAQENPRGHPMGHGHAPGKNPHRYDSQHELAIVEQNPEQAIALANTLNSEPERQSMLGQIASSWANQDLDAELARAWAESFLMMKRALRSSASWQAIGPSKIPHQPWLMRLVWKTRNLRRKRSAR